MKAMLTGYAGVLLRNDRITVLADPYIREGTPLLNQIEPDVLLITHSHGTHLDIPTLDMLLGGRRGVTVLASEGAYDILKDRNDGHSYVLLAPHSVWSERGVTFYSVKAEHNDRSAVGFILDDGEKTYYISGDTLYSFDVIDDVLDLVPDGVDCAFVPINGKGCNMNAKDAADFAYELGAKRAVPVHYSGTEISPEEFDFEDALILPPLVEVEL